MCNVASRRRRRIIVARRIYNRIGYATVRIEAVECLRFASEEPVMAIFKHRTQVRAYLDMVARKYRLCPKLLGLEGTRTYCFSFR